ncbi:hypothetical protein [Nocardioides sp. GXQ0305]|uniref:hypothetical protein n=1 Tax=Nocardioides sp. GXQ0305 TaxID=3423912 RepID=UPI003D7CA7C8
MPTLTDLLRRSLLDARREGDRAAAAALRRELTAEEQRAVVHEEVADLDAAATTYDGVDPVRADAAVAGARVLRELLGQHTA